MLIGYQLLSLVPQAPSRCVDTNYGAHLRKPEEQRIEQTLSFTEALPETSVGPRHDISCAVFQKSILGYR